MFFYENNSVYPVYVSDQERKDCMDLLLITDKISHTMCVLKFLRDLCVKWQNVGPKNKCFYKYCLQCPSSGKILKEHKETCLKINGK